MMGLRKPETAFRFLCWSLVFDVVRHVIVLEFLHVKAISLAFLFIKHPYFLLDARLLTCIACNTIHQISLSIHTGYSLTQKFRIKCCECYVV